MKGWTRRRHWRLYATARLFVNFFQPSFKLAEKHREGARVRKRYHAPAAPYQRLLADPRTPAAVRSRLSEIYAGLDPVLLSRQVRDLQQRLVELADAPVDREDGAVSPVSLEPFLAGLRTAWQTGEVRPTARPKVAGKRERRRPDPLAAVTLDLRNWFEVEPAQTGRQLPERLQAAHPGHYPEAWLRTLQRRLKIWRAEIAHTMVCGETGPVDLISGSAEL